MDRNEPGKATDRADYSLLTEEHHHDYDVESDGGVKSTDTEDKQRGQTYANGHLEQ